MQPYPHHQDSSPTCYVYILKCADSTYYTGITRSIPLRLAAHQAGLVHYTRKRKPLTLTRVITCPDRKTAAHLERRIKNTGALRWLQRHTSNA